MNYQPAYQFQSFGVSHPQELLPVPRFTFTNIGIRFLKFTNHGYRDFNLQEIPREFHEPKASTSFPANGILNKSSGLGKYPCTIQKSVVPAPMSTNNELLTGSR